MHIILGMITLVGTIAYLIYRMQTTAKAVKDLNRDTQGLQRSARRTLTSIFGTRLSRVRDPKLAAVILMIQLVRTGAPVTAAEKTAILDQIASELGVDSPQAIFEQAWSYTENRAFFSLVADELLPLLRNQLTIDEREVLIEMLQATADSYNGASDLQQGSINRLKKRLMET